MDEIIGSELGGCRVLERLGGGGMGTVYKAHHLRLDRDVALKVLAPDLAADPGFVVAFEREARSAARLEHPRIVQVYDAGAQDELHYILMQLIDGETALDRVAREGRLNPLDALRIIKAACEGLGVAHKQGIVHRDVKPGNILLGKDGTIRLSDFGLAMRVSDPGGSGEIRIIGTAQYLAPELGWGGEAEARSDIYSMGATYFCLLAGEPPFQGETDADTVAMHMNDPIPDVREFNPDVSAMAAGVIAKMMAKDKERRYASVPALLSDLNSPGMIMDQGESLSGMNMLDLGVRPGARSKERPSPAAQAAAAPPAPKAPAPQVRFIPSPRGPSLKTSGALALFAAAAGLCYAAAYAKLWPLLLGAAGLWMGAWWLTRFDTEDPGIVFLGLGAAALVLAGFLRIEPSQLFLEGGRIHLLPLAVALCSVSIALLSRLEKKKPEIAAAAVAAFAMIPAAYFFALPRAVSPAPSAETPLLAAAVLCALAAVCAAYFLGRRDAGLVLPFPLLILGASCAYLAGALRRLGPSQAWTAAFDAPFSDFPARFLREGGALPLGALLYATGLIILYRPRRKKPEGDLS